MEPRIDDSLSIRAPTPRKSTQEWPGICFPHVNRPTPAPRRCRHLPHYTGQARYMRPLRAMHNDTTLTPAVA